MKPLLVTAGEVMIETRLGDPAHRSLGGAAANAAAAFTAAGGRARLACLLAEDDALPALRDGLARLGLWGPDVASGGPFNAVYQIGGRCPYSRFGYTREGSAGGGLSVDQLDPTLTAAADVVLISGVFASLNVGSLAVCLHLLETAPPGALRAYDVNRRAALADENRARELYAELAPWLDLVKADAAEAELLWGPGGPRELLERARRRHPYVMITLGDAGLLLAAPEGVIEQPAVPGAATAIEETGAGDAALGAALHRLSSGNPPAVAARTASEFGARCVAVPGALGYLLP
jgi:sugar/nucleoside kinase (ribokinase family)